MSLIATELHSLIGPSLDQYKMDSLNKNSEVKTTCEHRSVQCSAEYEILIGLNLGWLSIELDLYSTNVGLFLFLTIDVVQSPVEYKFINAVVGNPVVVEKELVGE